ncbi:MAG: iron-containing alcohol dehydrogenase [Desulfamplus sp.]|nr:iron-containing alcohol dehydrogenase [Desulfamplus sp.]
MNFTFFSPVNIIFGHGTSKNLADYIAQHLLASYKKALLITGKKSSRADHIIRNLSHSGISHKIIEQPGEPSIDDIVKGAQTAKTAGVDFIVAVGGGSVIDAGKAIAAMATNTQDIMQYLEVIGKGRPLTEKPLPMIAIPTTSGTGAEVTCNAVISSSEHNVKVSLRSQAMYPSIAVIDPQLLLSMSPEVTASTGMDALTQLIESFTSRFANPITDALCKDGITMVSRSFKKAYDEPDNIEARSDMSIAALLSGITLANAKLGAVHGIAGPMGGMINASHGVICARLLGSVMTENISVLEKRLYEQGSENINQNDSHEPNAYLASAINKYHQIARLLTGNQNADYRDGVNYIDELVRYMNIRKIACPKPDLSQITLLSRQAELSSSMRGNPVALTSTQIRKIIQEEF